MNVEKHFVKFVRKDYLQVIFVTCNQLNRVKIQKVFFFYDFETKQCERVEGDDKIRIHVPNCALCSRFVIFVIKIQTFRQCALIVVFGNMCLIVTLCLRKEKRLNILSAQLTMHKGLIVSLFSNILFKVVILVLNHRSEEHTSELQSHA